MKKIVKALSILGMVIAFLIIIGSAGGLEQDTMGIKEMFKWNILGCAIGSASAFCYNKINN